MDYEDWQKQEESAGYTEFLAGDLIHNAIVYVHFISYSKGHNRKRRTPVEVELVSYGDGFHLPHNFKWDVYATEILGDVEDATNKLRDMVLGNQITNLVERYGLPL